MKKFFLLLLLTVAAFAFLQAQQEPPEVTLSPGRSFENVFDRFGNKYKLEDLLIHNPKNQPPKDDGNGMSGTVESYVVPSQLLCTAGYFDLYFENGSGMEGTFSPQTDRRAVICQLFTDISNFIVPVNPSQRVNIWVRDINNIIPGAYGTGVLGVASAFYTPPSIAAGSSGIIDGEIWKTINTGMDGYTNVTSPLLVQNSQTLGGSGAFYHGLVAFNFNNWSINWHTDLTSPTASGLYDFYSVALHEVTHALGFASLIDYTGDSKFGTAYNYYSRYDLFLQDQTALNLIETTTSCSMYDYSFNALLSASLTLSPNPATCGSSIPYSGSLDNTTCGTAVIFAGTVNQAVYTPDCFEPPSSLSHLEDQCYSPSPYGNNLYYCMSNANGSGPTYMKRYLKPEERSVLCDIGYRVNTTFGNGLYSANNYNYGGSQCATLDVAGVNDGINTGGTFTWFAATSGTVNINGIDLLGNDYNADEFECLEVMDGLGTVSITSGNSSAVITFTAGASTGIALLRYIPVNTTTGNRGNITYAYVYIYNGSCIATACNMIMNGGFENGVSCGSLNSHPCCPIVTIDCWEIIDWSPDYFVRGCIPVSYPDFTVPTGLSVCNPAADTWDNGAGGNDAFLGMGYYDYGSYYLIESEQSMLTTPLMPNTDYTLSFWARSTDGSYWNGDNTVMFRADVGPVAGSQYNSPFAYGDYLTEAYVPNDGQWHFYTLQFTFGGSLPAYNFLMGNIGAGNPWTSDVLIDDIVLTAANNAAVFLPPAGDKCVGITTINNLADYVFPAPPPGATFSGPGVSFTGSEYVFNAPGDGLYTIFYNYTNNLGCNITVPAQIYASVFQAPTVSMYDAFALGKLYADYGWIGNGGEGYYTGTGHIMGGVMYANFKNGLAADATMAIRTSYNGGTVFNNSYEFIDNISTNPLRITSSRIIELRDGSGYVSVSGFQVNRATPPHQGNQVFGVLYTEYDLAGNVVFSKKYPIAPFVGGMPLATSNISVTALKQLKVGSTPMDEFVITGQIMEGEETQMYVLHIDRNGALLWGGGRLYDLVGQPPSTQEMPLDIIEDPFNPNPAMADLFVVGYIDILNYGRDAFILRLESGMGNPLNFEMYDFSNKFDAFTGITAADYMHDPGFAICGYSHTSAFNVGEVLVMKMDKNMVPQWAYTYDDIDQPGNVHEAYDIVDIPNCITGEYSFNVAGSRNYFGFRDVMSIPIDKYGAPSGMDISDLGADEYAVSVDYIPTGRVTFFSQHTDYSQIPNSYLLFGCLSGHHKVQQTPASYTITNPPVNVEVPFMIEDAWLTNVINNNEQLLCLGFPSISDPNNNKGTMNFNGTNQQLNKGKEEAVAPESLADIHVFPNPATKNITIYVNGMPNASVMIRSAQGVLVGKAQKMGEGQYSFDASELASGIYLVEVVDENARKTTKFIKQ